MTFDIYELLDKGFLVFFAVVVLYAIFKTAKLITTYIPSIIESGKEFIGVWKDFVQAMNTNATAIDKNTIITDKNHRHSEIVLEELKEVNKKFISHDKNALDVKYKIEELVELIKEKNNSDEILELLQFIINKLEKEN